MSNNPYWNTKPDLTRLPQHMRDADNKPIPLRTAEVRAQNIIFPLVKEYGLNHPNGRLQALPHMPDSMSVSQFDGIAITSYDFTGKKPLCSIIVKKEAMPEFLRGYITAYIRNNKSWTEFDNLIEELKKNE